ncbi:hypothetical protein MLD38_016991 [Melastoma candidum]|uniref:Uncharacterized protein n=1 Tax=Melastoma candidum TaxID=119954 RepID=A0ACB9QSP2_9MYRT|nr:hypothetical protein MLD38_016991 [Melastoma candidum]
MNALKEKLSRLLFDPPSSSAEAAAASPNSSPSSSYSSPHQLPDDSDQTQAMPNAKEGKSFASYFSFIMPTGRSDSSRSRDAESDVELYRALHVERTDENPEWQYFSLDRHVGSGNHCSERSMGNQESSECAKIREDRKSLHVKIENDDPGSGRSTSGSEMFEEAMDQCSPEKPLDNLLDESTFISPTLYEFLLASLPNIVKGCQWALLYSTLKHGISLRTLIRKSSDFSGPCLLIVGDKQGAVFGGMLQSPLRPTAKRKYQGSNQTFVFTTLYGQPRLFRATGANRYYYMCLNDLLALGGGGNFALRLDGDLLSGTSGPCETFGNSCLAHSMDFELKNVELWGFTHSSSYITRG